MASIFFTGRRDRTGPQEGLVAGFYGNEEKKGG